MEYNVDTQTLDSMNPNETIFFKACSFAEHLYLIQHKCNLYIFDVETYQNIAKVTLKCPALSRIIYQPNTDQYFLFIVYETMELDVQVLKYVCEHGMKAAVTTSS